MIISGVPGEDSFSNTQAYHKNSQEKFTGGFQTQESTEKEVKMKHVSIDIFFNHSIIAEIDDDIDRKTLIELIKTSVENVRNDFVKDKDYAVVPLEDFIKAFSSEIQRHPKVHSTRIELPDPPARISFFLK